MIPVGMSQNIGPLSKQLTIIIGLTVVGFMAFGLALSFYRNVLFENTLESIRKSNNSLGDTIEESKHNLEYFTSTQFKDKYAKQNLNQLRTGEKALIITEVKEPVIETSGDQFTSTEKQQLEFEELLRQMPIVEHWKLYLFHRDEIEKIKRAL
jgi:hypothetical protein